MEGYARLFARKRSLVIAFVCVMTVLAFVGVARLEFDDVPRGIFVSEDEAHERLEQLYAEFGSDDNQILLVLEADDWFTRERVDYLLRLTEEVRAVERVDAVAGLSDLVVFDGGELRPLLRTRSTGLDRWDDLRREVDNHPLARGRLLSEDGRTTLIVARLEEDAIAIGDIQPATEAIRAVVEGLKAEGVRVRQTGVPTVRVEIYEAINREQWIFFAVGSAICLFLSLLLFRSLQAVLITGLPPVVGSLWALGFMGLLGEKMDILGSVLPMLVIVIGFTDCVHLMIDVRISRGAGISPLESATEAIRHLGLPCALTSLTTGVGFGSLALGNPGIIARFGLLAALSIVLCFLAVITTFPLLASWFPSVGTSESVEDGGVWSRRSSRLIDFVTGHSKLVVALGITGTLALILSATTLVPENRLIEALPRDEAYEALKHCEESFGGVLPTYVQLEWEEPLVASSPEVLAALQEVEDLFRGTEHTSAPLSILTLLELIPGARASPGLYLPFLPAEIAGRFLRADLGKALVQAQVPDAGSDVMLPLYSGLSSGLAEIEQRYPGIEMHLTGTDVVARSNINRMITDLTRSLGFAVLIIFGVIALEFRSLALGLASLVPNLFPLALVAGLLVLFDQPLQMTSAILFTVLLGLAVDDTIHFLARHRRERLRRDDRREVMRASFLAVGKAIAITTLVLGSGFLALVFSAVPTTQIFGFFGAVGLLAALVGDLILLPALLMLRHE